jgi:ribulose bisphosphate carboxylase small subunit
MAPNQSTFKECLAEIACNPDKNDEYTRLVGVNAEVVYNDIYQFLNPSIMDLIITKASKLDSMDNFSSSSSKHTETFMWDL